MSEEEKPSWGDFFREAPLWPRIKVIFLGCLGLSVAVASSGMVVWLLKGSGRPAPRKPASVEKKVEPFTFSYELQDVALSLSGRSGKTLSHGQISLTMDLPSAEAKQWMELNRAKALDTIYSVADGFHVEDLLNVAGRARFKQALLKAYSERFQAYAPREIALSQVSLN